jgi:Protein of unknown function (DUF2939)
MGKRALLIPGLIVALYVAAPYVTLLKLRADLRNHDVQALQQDIDWDSVRTGLKNDFANAIEGRPVATKVSAAADDDLPPFGAGFAVSMASKAIDHQVTPARLADAFAAPARPGGAQPAVQAARFDGATSFFVELRAAGQAATDAPVRLDLALVRHGWHVGWQVTHVCVPASLMQHSETHIS